MYCHLDWPFDRIEGRYIESTWNNLVPPLLLEIVYAVGESGSHSLNRKECPVCLLEGPGATLPLARALYHSEGSE